MAKAKDIIKRIKEEEIEWVDLRFTDPKGKWQHLTMVASLIGEDELEDGLMFDGSSIEGWKAINESDMAMVPDPNTAWIDPFYSHKTLSLICSIQEPRSGKPYSRCPRALAQKALDYLGTTGLADTAYFGPEPEFFIFDDVRYKSANGSSFYSVDSIEAPWNTDRVEEGGNLANKIQLKEGYFPVAPNDTLQDMRSEMLLTMGALGVPIEKQHHEVATAQHELGIKFAELISAADNVMIYKYVVRNIAKKYGKTATFMPKPIVGDNGSGMHVHQSVWKDGKNLFAGNGYAGLSDFALYYIGGIIKHAKALNAFTNPSTNSYKRLVPGYEAPVLLAYSSRNRSASCRIPFTANPKAKRVEVRFPDPTANPYLCFSAIIMAGLDGIVNKIHPGPAMDKNLYDLPPAELAKVPTVCGSLQEAIYSLAADHEFLLKGGVFSKDQIESYLELKQEEQDRYRMTPHPVEFEMYYSV